MGARDAQIKEDDLRWLLREIRGSKTPQEVFDALCSRLVARGTPLERVSLVIFLLHPTIHGMSMRWRSGQELEVMFHPHGLQDDPAYSLSPVAAMREGRLERLHQPLESPETFDYALFDELKAEGLTDYLLMPLVFQDGSIHCLSVATAKVGGFAPEDIERLEDLVDLVATATELLVRRVLTERLLTTYLGRNAAAKVLEGQTRRGDGESIHAVVLMCDLRGFTRISNQHSRQELLELLDVYFETIVGAIDAHGGEVLKFIGDAVLAVFPCDLSSRADACRRAANAARAAHHSTRALNAIRRERGRLEIHFGMALHIGNVMYGNIGAPERLDFTVIGPAVNIASRLESMCGSLERSILVSEEFAAHFDEELEDMGAHSLKGMDGATLVYALSPEENWPRSQHCNQP